MPTTARPNRRFRSPAASPSVGAAVRSARPARPAQERQSTPEPAGRAGTTRRSPILDLLDLLGRRWALRILWELSTGPLRFTEIQDRCDAMSPSVLNQRLAELVAANVVLVNGDRRYGLTVEGSDLVSGLKPLDAWARRWARRSARGRS
ncbi:MAG: winged helix-turn-helix transcriptional regulator [Alphaproteobacteria bacterium]